MVGERTGRATRNAPPDAASADAAADAAREVRLAGVGGPRFILTASDAISTDAGT